MNEKVNDPLRVKNNGSQYRVEQDIQPYLDEAKRARDMNERTGGSKRYRSFAIIPDIVAVDIFDKYGINIHQDEFMTNPVDVNRLKQIIIKDYPKLLTRHIRGVN